MAKQQEPSLPAVQQTAALQTFGGQEIPDFLKESSDGREQIDQNDLSIPRLVVINALSKQAVEQTAKVGAIVDSVTGNVVYTPAGTPMRGVFLAVRKQRTKWRPKGSGTGIECHSPDGITAQDKGGICKGVPTDRCAVCEFAQFSKNADGSIKPPVCTEYREFLFLAEGAPMPLVISLGKAAARDGKKLVEALNSSMGMTNRPIYAFAYTVETVQMMSKGNVWHAFQIKPAGFPTKELYEQAKAQYDKFKTALRKQGAGAAEEEPTEALDDGSAPRM